MTIKDNNDYVFQGKKLEVTVAECGGDFNKMLKKFTRKVRKDGILKEVFNKMFYKTKGQKDRASKLKARYEHSKVEDVSLEDE